MTLITEYIKELWRNFWGDSFNRALAYWFTVFCLLFFGLVISVFETTGAILMWAIGGIMAFIPLAQYEVGEYRRWKIRYLREHKSSNSDNQSNSDKTTGKDQQ